MAGRYSDRLATTYASAFQQAQERGRQQANAASAPLSSGTPDYVKSYGGGTSSAAAPQSEGMSKIGKIFDVLSQPVYAATESYLDAINKASKSGDDISGWEQTDATARGVLGFLNLGNYGTSNSKMRWSDVLRDPDEVKERYDSSASNVPGVSRGFNGPSDGPLSDKSMDLLKKTDIINPDKTTGSGVDTFMNGLIIDMATDPTSWIPGAAVAAPFKAAGKVAMKGTQAVADAGSIGSKTANDALKIVGKFSKKAPKEAAEEAPSFSQQLSKKPELSTPDFGEYGKNSALQNSLSSPEGLGGNTLDAFAPRSIARPNPRIEPIAPEVPPINEIPVTQPKAIPKMPNAAPVAEDLVPNRGLQIGPGKGETPWAARNPADRARYNPQGVPTTNPAGLRSTLTGALRPLAKGEGIPKIPLVPKDAPSLWQNAPVEEVGESLSKQLLAAKAADEAGKLDSAALKDTLKATDDVVDEVAGDFASKSPVHDTSIKMLNNPKFVAQAVQGLARAGRTADATALRKVASLLKTTPNLGGPGSQASKRVAKILGKQIDQVLGTPGAAEKFVSGKPAIFAPTKASDSLLASYKKATEETIKKMSAVEAMKRPMDAAGQGHWAKQMAGYGVSADKIRQMLNAKTYQEYKQVWASVKQTKKVDPQWEKVTLPILNAQEIPGDFIAALPANEAAVSKIPAWFKENGFVRDEDMVGAQAVGYTPDPVLPGVADEVTTTVVKKLPKGKTSQVVRNVIDEAKKGAAPAKKQIAEKPSMTKPERAEADALASGQGMDPELYEMTREVITNQQIDRLKPSGKYKNETDISKARRDSPRAGEGTARHRELNAGAQATLFNKVVARAFQKARQDPEIVEMLAKNTDGKPLNPGKSWQANNKIVPKRALRQIVSDLEQVEGSLVAQGATLHVGRGTVGVPLTTSQVMRSMLLTDEGTEFLLQRVLSGWGQRTAALMPATSKALGATEKGMQGGIGVQPLLELGDLFGKYAAKVVPDAEDLATTYSRIDDIAGHVSRSADPGAVDDVFNQVTRNAQGKVLNQQGVKVGMVADAKAASEAVHGAVFEEFMGIVNDPRVIKGMLSAMHANAAESARLFARNTEELSDVARVRLMQAFKDPSASGNMVIAQIAKPEILAATDAKLLSRARKTEISRANQAAAAENVAEEIADQIPTIDADAAVRRSDLSDLATKIDDVKPGKLDRTSQMADKAQKVYREEFDDAMKVAEGLIDEGAQTVTPLENIADLGQMVALETTVGRALDGVFRKFVASYDNSTLHAAMVSTGGLGGVHASAFRRTANNMHKAAIGIANKMGISTDAIYRDVFKALQDQIPGNAAYDDVAKEFNGLMETVFQTAHLGTDRAESITGLFVREGFDLAHMNSKLSQMFGKDAAEKFGLQFDMKAADNSMIKAVEQWRKWGRGKDGAILDSFDPLDFVAKMERVAGELATETAVSREFYRMATEQGLVSAAKKADHVPINRSTQVRIKSAGMQTAKTEESLIARYLPKNANGVTYIHKDLLPEIQRMDELMLTAHGNNTPFGNFLKQNIDPMLSMWKAGMTVWRPGHHVRNMMSDLGLMNLVSGVKDPRYMSRAIGVMNQVKKGAARVGDEAASARETYSLWDAQAALQGIKKGENLPQGVVDDMATKFDASGNALKPGVSIATTKDGLKFTADDVFNGIMNRGTLPSFRQTEDIIDTGATGWSRQIAQATHWENSAAQANFKAVGAKVAGFTEGRDDVVRIMHSLHLIEKTKWPKGMSKSEILDSVAAKIRKTHPDGTDLTPFEKNVMRRIIPFYSWNRKAIPMIMANAAMHPGRVMAYPKAMYNFAQSQGVDLNSVGDPFPDDQLFPDFMKEKATGVGFQVNGNYYTFDLGQPVTDVANQFMGSGGVTSGLLGMTNPLIQAGAALGTGSQLGSGIPVNDVSDYLDQNIPGVNALSGITGISATGTIGSILNPTDDKLIDKNYQVEKGNRGGPVENPEYMSNWLTGTQVLNGSKQNYLNLAQINRRDKISEQMKKEQAQRAKDYKNNPLNQGG